MLEVEFLEYRSADFGVTAVIPGFGFLADLFTEPYLVKWEIADGVARSAELPGVAVPGGHVRRRRRRRAVARAAGGVPAARGARSRAGRARRRRGCRRAPSHAAAADGLRTIPPREIGGNLDIRQLVAGSRLYLPGRRPGRALLDRRPPLRPGRRRGVRNGDRGRGVGHRRASTSTATTRGAAASRRTRRPHGPGRRSFATTGIPVDDAMDLTVAAREALSAMIDHLVATRGLRAGGGLRALQRGRRPQAVRGRRRALPDRVGAPAARHLRVGYS